MPQNQNVLLYGTLSSSSVSGNLQSGNMSASLSIPQSRVELDYERLINKPRINGVELSGNKTSQDLFIVSENSTEGWASMAQYLPKQGEICIYTDYKTFQDDLGNTIVCPGIKIGDGNSYLIDLPFTDAELRHEVLQRLSDHEQNTTIHITQAEREFWNNKLNYDAVGEELILTRN